jgi:hypothetical protein
VKAREAIGGDEKIRSIKTLVLKGEYWSSQAVITDMRAGQSTVVEQLDTLEVRMLFPRHYLEIHTNERFSRWTGLRDDEPINEVASRAAPAGSVPSHFNPDALARELANFTRLVLGSLARTDTMKTVAAVPEGLDSVRLTDASGFSALLDLDPASHLPLRVVYRTSIQVLPPGPVKAGQGTGRSVGAGVSDMPEVEMTMSFEDRRNVDGVKVPFKVSWTAKGIKLWEMRFTSAAVDSSLTDASFRR